MTPAICGGYTIQAKHQRLFHLGRELKSPKRSLEALLGFGRNGIYLVHLHSTQPRPLELSSDEEEDVIKSTASSSLKQKKGTQEEMVLETNSSHGVGGTTGGGKVVVDLYTGTMGCINRLIHSMLLMMKSLCDLPLKMIWNETKRILLIEVVQTYAQKMQYFMVCLEHSAISKQST